MNTYTIQFNDGKRLFIKADSWKIDMKCDYVFFYANDNDEDNRHIVAAFSCSSLDGIWSKDAVIVGEVRYEKI